MPDSTVIQEFLVSLGFRLDSAQQQRFDAALAANRAQAAAFNQALADVGKQLGILGQQLTTLAGDPTRKAEEAAGRLTKTHELLTRNVKQLGLTAIATTGAFVTGFAEIARRYDQLHYIAQQTGLTTAQISGMQFAGSQVGGLNIVAAHQAFATTMQTNPGIAGLMRSWNVGTVEEFEKHIAGMPAFLQKAFSEMIGLTYEFTRSWQNSAVDITRETEAHIERLRLAGVDTIKVFGDEKQNIGEVGQAVRDLNTIWDALDVTMVKGFQEAYPYMDRVLKGIIDLQKANLAFIGTHPGAALAESLGAAYISAVGLLKVLGLLSGTAGAAGGVMARFGLGAIFGGAVGIGVQTALTPSAAGNQKEIDAERALLEQALQAAHPPHYAAGGVIGRTGPIIAHAGETIVPTQQGGSFFNFLATLTTSLSGWLSGSSAYRPLVQVIGWTPGAPITAGGGGVVQASYAPAGRDAAGRMVSPPAHNDLAWPNAAAPTSGNWEVRHFNYAGIRRAGVNAGPNAGGFAAYGSPEEGIQGIEHLLGAYSSKHHLNTLTGIISRWAPPNENNTALLIARAAKVMGVSPTQQLNLSDPGTMNKLVEAMIRNEQGGQFPIPGGLATVDRVTRALAGGGTMATGLPGWFNDPNHGGFAKGFDAEKQAQAMERFKAQIRSMPSAQLGGNYTVNHDAGDRSVEMNQTNHITVQGDASVGHRIAGDLNRNAGWMTANARTQLS